ncbi:MAG: hypothetical protein KDB82_03845 [Planctomycetes bacterium]|nr:hypothetical protein [Planctomycetota bacterium]
MVANPRRLALLLVVPVLLAAGAWFVLAAPAPKTAPNPQSSPMQASPAVPQHRIAPGPYRVRVTLPDGRAAQAIPVHLGARIAYTETDGVAVFDGVPPGTFDAWITQPGCDRVSWSAELPPGARDEEAVQLAAADRVRFKGVLKLESGLGAPGVSLRMEPTDVNAAIQGPLEFRSDWEGAFELLEIPAGRYRVTGAEPGFEPFDVALEVKPGMQPVEWTLNRVVDAGKAVIRVRDDKGTAVTGATVVLAVAWPRGEYARAVTDAAGLASFDELSFSDANRGTDVRADVLPRRFNLRVEAPGFAPSLEVLTRAEKIERTVVLQASSAVEESEPNGSAAQANLLRFDAPTSLKLDREDDSDMFKFRIEHAAHVHVDVVLPAITTTLNVYDAGSERVYTHWTYGNNKLEVDLSLKPGEYLLELCARDKKATCADALTLTVHADVAADVDEPNDAGSAGYMMLPRQDRYAWLMPAGDVDTYRFHTTQLGVARFRVRKPPVTMHLQVYNESGDALAWRWSYADNDLQVEVPVLEATWLRLEVTARDKGAYSVTPYRLECDWIPGDAAPVSHGRELERRLSPDSLVGGSTCPSNDVDTWRVDLPSSGELHVESWHPRTHDLRVLDAHGKPIEGGWAYGGNRLVLVCDVPGPTTYRFEVKGHGAAEWSPSPYTLQTWFLPCDDYERAGRNDTPQTASPVEAHEPVRGALTPAGDVDLYRFVADFPGYLTVSGMATGTWNLRLRDARMKPLVDRWAYGSNPLAVSFAVDPGEYIIEAAKHGPRDKTTIAYSFAMNFERAEPGEVVPLASDPTRDLTLGEARAWAPDRNGDLDRFRASVTVAGEYWFRVYAPTTSDIHIYDELTGKDVASRWTYKGIWEQKVSPGGPTRYVIELSPHGPSTRTHEFGYVMLSAKNQPFATAQIDSRADPQDPTLVTFTRRNADGQNPASFEIDADRDGTIDASTETESVSVRFREEGVFAVDFRLVHKNGVVSRGRAWVVAMGARERKGVHVNFSWPGEGELIEHATPCRAMALSYTGTPVTCVNLEVDGRFIAADRSVPFEFDVPWRTLGAGAHTLRVIAEDAMGNRAQAERAVNVSRFFDLSPADGAVVTGNEVRVSWRSPEFGLAAVRFRKAGETAWQEARGDNGRRREVVLPELEAGVQYELQPLDGEHEGPVCKVTRVKGLAFGQARYGANIRRDYDQRLGISVRNHAEQPMVVHLQCGEIADSLLLAGFVGEGSDGEPFTLQPGEERNFLLGLSAQDVVKERHSFPIRIVSEDGYADEAEVEVSVKLPEVKLEWQDGGVVDGGLAHRYFLINKGDTITDLDVASSNAGLRVTPSIEHTMLKAGERIEVVAHPELHKGFTDAEAQFVAKAVGKTVPTDVKVALPEGEKLFPVQLVPGEQPGAEDDYDQTLRVARAMTGPYLVPGLVDWTQKQNPEDTDGDGRPDRWTVDNTLDRILWIGSDTTGDGEVDFTSADIGYDGIYEYSAYRTPDGWEPTNLVEAWLETNFSLPWARDRYEKHNLQVLMNEEVIGELEDGIPEGNYAFRIPPSAIHFDESGAPQPGKIEIRSEHLRGGHYVVNSDFRLKLRLTGTRVWVSAKDEQSALIKARNSEGVSMDGTDYSLSSADVEIDAPGGIEPGKAVTVRAHLRNFGASGAGSVPVALMLAVPGQKGIELTRTWVHEPSLTGDTVVELPWNVASGDHTLQVVVDPDNVLPETDRANNTAMAPLNVPGDDTGPALSLNFEDGAEIDGTLLDIDAQAEDDSGIARVEARVDDGLWQPLQSTNGHSGKALLQPGDHKLDVRATDSSGNQVTKSANVRSNALAPKYDLLEPAGGAKVSGRKADVALRTPENARLAATRVNGGPWKRLPIDENGTAAGTVPVPYGDAQIETMVVDDHGAISRQSVDVVGQDRRSEDEPVPDQPADEGVVDVEGFGPVDMFGPPNTLSVPRSESAAMPAAPEAQHRHLRPGGTIQVHRQQKSWYCTNRPKIGVGFQMPDWLRAKKLPLPGTKEFAEMEQRLLQALRDQGIDTSSLERFQRALMNRIGTMEQPGDLPGFLESLGLTENRPSGLDQVELEIWRDGMKEKAQAWWIRLLASGDPGLIAEGLKARAHALGQYDEAMQEHAEAAIETIHANQKITEDVLSMVPYVGEAMDLVAAATGETLSGDKIGGWERLFRATMVLGPIGLEQIIKRSPRAQKALSALLERASQLKDAGKARLLKALGMEADDLARGVANVREALDSARRKLMGTLDEAADSARIGWRHSAEGLADAEVWREARELAEQRIKKLTDLVDPQTGKILNNEGFERAMLEIQKDKLAQNMLNRMPGEHLNNARKAMKNQMEGVLYHEVDQAVNATLEASDEVQELARKHGLKTKIDPTTGKHVPDGWSVETMNISNTGGPPKPVTTIGRDRDVTYQIIGTAEDGSHVKIDIHHDISKPTYAEEFYKRTHGGELPDVSNPELRRKLLDKNLDLHDQMVTSKWHPEAYNPGEVPLDDFLDRGVMPTLTRPEDIRDTFVFKSDHWFNRAKGYADDAAEYGKNMAEGMRQATKQWDNQVLPRLKQFGNLDKVPTIPAHLEKAVDIMKQVDKLEISPQQAEAMLAALPVPGGVKLTPESAVRQMGTYLEGLEKTAGHAYRKLGTARVLKTLEAVPSPGTNRWAEDSLNALNDALRNGEISGETFSRQRANIISGRVQASSQAGTSNAWQGLKTWLGGIPEGTLLSPIERRALAKTIQAESGN